MAMRRKAIGTGLGVALILAAAGAAFAQEDGEIERQAKAREPADR